MKIILTPKLLQITVLSFFINSVYTQSDNAVSITIEKCYELAKTNYPLIRQLDIIEKSTQYNLSNASHGKLPQISLNGQASYQSDVTMLPIDIPNMDIQPIAKDQYKIYGEVYQPLTNFSKVNISKDIIEQNAEIEKQKIEVDLYKIKERINQVYFGVLLIDEKIEQLEIVKSDLDSALERIEAGIEGGTSTLTDKRLLEVEQISIDQQIDENKANQKAYLDILGLLTGREEGLKTKLIRPEKIFQTATINRPELKLFQLQTQVIDLQQKKLDKNLRPNLGLFLQGGYGRPALNFLSNDFELYYIGGIRFNWNLFNYYGHKNKLKNLDLGRTSISFQQETFLLNTNITHTQQSAEIEKYIGLVNSDKEIIRIREEVFNTAKVQLDNGLITTIDYVKYLNDVNKARQMLLLHETQLLLAQFNLQTTTGN
ncbi:MAG: TolC family protein [Bacteroidia bacterium]|nr:TolC family protein [Bacteroidia bacterium]